MSAKEDKGGDKGCGKTWGNNKGANAVKRVSTISAIHDRVFMHKLLSVDSEVNQVVTALTPEKLA